MRADVDILVLTCDRPSYTRLALERLLSTCDDDMRVWIWQNGDHAETVEVVRSFLGHPRVHAFHHNDRNTGLKGQWEPIDWLLTESRGAYVSKVDDDCLVADGWADVLRRAHEDVPELGVVGCWRFRPEDLRPRQAKAKLQTFPGGHRILRNSWIEGTGFLMKRACVDDLGPLPPGRRFPKHCIHLADAGWVNGWYFPFVRQEHMDDPRSPFWSLEDDRSAARGRTPEQHVAKIRAHAFYVQEASLDPRRYLGWRERLRGLVPEPR